MSKQTLWMKHAMQFSSLCYSITKVADFQTLTLTLTLTLNFPISSLYFPFCVYAVAPSRLRENITLLCKYYTITLVIIDLATYSRESLRVNFSTNFETERVVFIYLFQELGHALHTQSDPTYVSTNYVCMQDPLHIHSCHNPTRLNRTRTKEYYIVVQILYYNPGNYRFDHLLQCCLVPLTRIDENRSKRV